MVWIPIEIRVWMLIQKHVFLLLSEAGSSQSLWSEAAWASFGLGRSSCCKRNSNSQCLDRTLVFFLLIQHIQEHYLGQTGRSAHFGAQTQQTLVEMPHTVTGQMSCWLFKFPPWSSSYFIGQGRCMATPNCRGPQGESFLNIRRRIQNVGTLLTTATLPFWDLIDNSRGSCFHPLSLSISKSQRGRE